MVSAAMVSDALVRQAQSLGFDLGIIRQSLLGGTIQTLIAGRQAEIRIAESQQVIQTDFFNKLEQRIKELQNEINILLQPKLSQAIIIEEIRVEEILPEILPPIETPLDVTVISPETQPVPAEPKQGIDLKTVALIGGAILILS